MAQVRESLPPVHGHGLGKTGCERHQPEQTRLYQLVEAHYPALIDQLAQQGKSLPDHVHQEFEAYLKCGRLEHCFLRVRCDKCHFERLVEFSCKKRGFCPSCGARRMAETDALLADEAFPDVPLRQWVTSFPFPLRYLFAAHPLAMGQGAEHCGRCGGSVRVIACIEDQDVMPDKAGQALDRILAHLERKEQNTPALPHLAPPTRASPGAWPLFAGRVPTQQHSARKEASENRIA